MSDAVKRRLQSCIKEPQALQRLLKTDDVVLRFRIQRRTIIEL